MFWIKIREKLIDGDGKNTLSIYSFGPLAVHNPNVTKEKNLDADI